jgi:hypothetical protein
MARTLHIQMSNQLPGTVWQVIIFATYAMIGGLDADYTAFKDLSPGKFIIMVFFYVFYSVVSGCARYAVG